MAFAHYSGAEFPSPLARRDSHGEQLFLYSKAIILFNSMLSPIEIQLYIMNEQQQHEAQCIRSDRSAHEFRRMEIAEKEFE